MSNACSSSKARISASASACWCVSGADGVSSRTPCAREGAQKPSRFLISVEFQLFPFSLRRPKEIPVGEKGGQRPDEGPAEMSALHVDRTVNPTPLPRGEGLETRRRLRSLFVPPVVGAEPRGGRSGESKCGLATRESCTKDDRRYAN